jgi:starch phosphorylase
MPATEKVGKDYLRGRQDARKLDRVLDHLVDRTEDEAHRAALIALKEEFNATDQNVAIVYGSMEFYDREDNDLKGGGGLGVLAGDTRRVCEDLGIPQVVLTPFYTQESHQVLKSFWQHERNDDTDPSRLYTRLGQVGIDSSVDAGIGLDVYGRQLGSTTMLTITEPNFGELYPGSNSGDHRLYQEAALGFGGYKALKDQDITPAFTQLNEAPVVFLAIAQLDDLVSQGVPFQEALERTRSRTLFTNHTLVPAVEGEFGRAQFENLIVPNINSQEVREWVGYMFDHAGRLKLSLLAAEVSGVQSGVSKLHAEVAEYYDKAGNRVEFKAVTNGISNKWINPGILQLFRERGIYDEFSAPAEGYAEAIDGLDIDTIRTLKAEGRTIMNEVLATRSDQYGEPIEIPADAVLFNFKRRFANYKRPSLPFEDPERLAQLLVDNNAHFVLTGKPHPNDDPMKGELHRVLSLIDADPRLKERVHYVEDYDEEVGRALTVGADVAINLPVVGEEACGTSWMKDIANFEVLISTPDGGVADVMPIECLEVSGDECEMTYVRMQEAAEIVRSSERLEAEVKRELTAYLETISGARMMFDYVDLFAANAAKAMLRKK